jgi:hypothetical protein
VRIQITASAIGIALVMWTAAAAADGTSTECTKNGFCYCIQNDLKSTIATRVGEIRARIAEQHKQGKAVGYLSIPISTAAGSYFGINTQIADRTKARVEKRFGARAAWLLNTAAKENVLPAAAKGPDYMLMWTRVLEGDDGFGRDFDFIYFTGPSDFGRFFSLDGRADMERLERFYDDHAKSDPDLAKIPKLDFRNYYALRASVSYSSGSHDEWNIIRKINEHRRAADGKTEFGVTREMAVLFDGAGVAPGLLNASTGEGEEHACTTGQ